MKSLARVRSVSRFLLLIALSINSRSHAALLSGYVYIDRDNNGQLAYNNQANPEWVIPGVTIQLLNYANPSAPVVLMTDSTDAIGRYEFAGLGAGTYALRQVQPVEYVDGLDTVGQIRNLALTALNPAGTSPGSANPSGPGSLLASIVLIADSRGDEYNFGERGLAPAYASKRYLLATAPPPVFTPPPDIPNIPNDVPEPASLALAMAAGLGFVAARRAR